MTSSVYRLPNGTTPVLVSAGTTELLAAEAAALHCYSTAHHEATPQAISAMLFRTRASRPHRALAMVTGRGELLDALQAIACAREHRCVVRAGGPAAARRVGYVFPGQGGQCPGMGRVCYASSSAFRAEADRCAAAFSAETGESPLGYLLGDGPRATDSASNVQPALFTQMAALAAMWRSFGVKPEVTIGHSQGEIAAAYVSGLITLADAVRVVTIRAQAADELAGDYAMAVVAADRGTCEEVLARCCGWAELSVINSAGITGISGERTAVAEIVDTFTGRGVFTRIIGVHYPAHTSLINSLGRAVRTETRRQLDNPAFRDAGTVCLGSTFGGPITPDLPPEEYWFQNLRNTVRFDKTVAAALSLGIDTFVELTEHPTLQLALGENLAAAGVAATVVGTSRRTAEGLDDFTANLALLAVNDLDYPWQCLSTEIDSPPPLPLTDFPNTRMNEVALWLPYNGGDDGIDGRPAPVAAPAARAAAGEPRLLAEQWVRLARRALASPRTIGVVDRGSPELAAALCGAAPELGATARVLTPGADTDSAAPDLDTYVILLPQSPELDDAGAVAEVSEFFGRRAWLPPLTGAVTGCWLVTVGGEVVLGADPPPNPVHAAAAAGFRGIGAEFPRVRFGHLDLPAEATPPPAILSALHTRDEPELALRGGALYAKRIGELPGADGVGADWSAPDHTLVVGGTGNLGLEFCAYAARRGTRRITLVSRSGGTGEAADRLRRIRAETSARIDVQSCDITDRAAVALLAQRYRDTPADLIIHAAVQYSDLECGQITVPAADRLLRAKVVGIGQVLDAFPRTVDCRVVLCSSVAATIGGRGQAVYAAANRMLDAMGYRRRAGGLNCVSVQWGQWTTLHLEPAGWAKLLATGLLSMRPADALAVGLTRLPRDTGNVIVAAFDLDRARPVLTAYGYGPLLSQLPTPSDDAPAISVPQARGDLRQRLTHLLAQTIGVEAAGAIDTEVPMVAIGLDSLQALEFQRRVKAEFDYDLAVADLLGGASVADVLPRLGG